MGGCKASSLQIPWIRGLFFGDGDVARLEMSGRLAMLNVSFALSTVWKKMKEERKRAYGPARGFMPYIVGCSYRCRWECEMRHSLRFRRQNID